MLSDAFIEFIQLIGSLYAYGLVGTALVTYLIIWPFDRASRSPR